MLPYPIPEREARFRLFTISEVVKFAFRWARLVWRQLGVVTIKRRAIGTHILQVVGHITKDVWMVLGWQRAHAHEFLGANFDDWNA